MFGGFFRYESEDAKTIDKSFVVSTDDSRDNFVDVDDRTVDRCSLVLFANFEEKELWCDVDGFEERPKDTSDADAAEEEDTDPSSNVDEIVPMVDLALKADQKDFRCLHRNMSKAEFAIRERIMSVLRFFEPLGAVDRCTLQRKRFVRVSRLLESRSYKIDECVVDLLFRVRSEFDEAAKLVRLLTSYERVAQYSERQLYSLRCNLQREARERSNALYRSVNPRAIETPQNAREMLIILLNSEI